MKTELDQKKKMKTEKLVGNGGVTMENETITNEKAVSGSSSSIDPSSFKLLVSCPSGLSPSQVLSTSTSHDSCEMCLALTVI